LLMIHRTHRSTLFPYTTLFRSNARKVTRNCLHLPYYKNFNYYGDDKMFLKKKWSITFIAMITAFFLAACGGTENANEDAEKADQNEPKAPEVEMTSSVE